MQKKSSRDLIGVLLRLFLNTKLHIQTTKFSGARQRTTRELSFQQLTQSWGGEVAGERQGGERKLGNNLVLNSQFKTKNKQKKPHNIVKHLGHKIETTGKSSLISEKPRPNIKTALTHPNNQASTTTTTTTTIILSSSMIIILSISNLTAIQNKIQLVKRKNKIQTFNDIILTMSSIQ